MHSTAIRARDALLILLAAPFLAYGAYIAWLVVPIVIREVVPVVVRTVIENT
jgi:hypothetical protein